MRSWRTIAMWVVLLVLCFALARLFSAAPEMTEWMCSVPVVLVPALFAVRHFRARRYAKVQTRAASLIEAGRNRQALEVLAGTKGWASHLNRSTALLRLWRLDEAAVAQDSARKELTDSQVGTWPWLRAALVDALLGKVEAAQESLRRAGLEADAPGDEIKAVEAVLACRRGDWTEAMRVFDLTEVRALGGFAWLLGPLRAWAHEQTGAERLSVDLPVLLGEAGPDQVRKHWPELAAFVEARAAGIATLPV